MAFRNVATASVVAAKRTGQSGAMACSTALQHAHRLARSGPWTYAQREAAVAPGLPSSRRDVRGVKLIARAAEGGRMRTGFAHDAPAFIVRGEGGKEASSWPGTFRQARDAREGFARELAEVGPREFCRRYKLPVQLVSSKSRTAGEPAGPHRPGTGTGPMSRMVM